MDFRKMRMPSLHSGAGVLQAKFMRRSVEIEAKLPTGLQIRLAQTQNELTEVFRLQTSSGCVYSAESGLDSNRRRSFQLFPNSAVAMAVWNGKLVGTMTHILDAKGSLPLDKTSDIQNLRTAGRVLGELSNIAVESNNQKKELIILLLIRFMFEYTRRHLNVNTWIYRPTPRNAAFFSYILGFETLNQTANDRLMPVMYLDFENFGMRMERIYQNSKPASNIYDFLFERAYDSELEIPDLKYYKAWTHIHDPATVDIFLNHRFGGLQALSPTEVNHMLFYYQRADEKKEFADLVKYAGYQRPRSQRFAVNCPAKLIGEHDDLVVSGFVKNVSSRGFMIELAEHMMRDQNFQLSIEISPTKKIRVSAVNRWYGEAPCCYGFSIMDQTNPDWNQFVDWLQQNMNSNQRL
jgi:hypothetical protein